jgi:lipoyl(octanoyl) transferase
VNWTVTDLGHMPYRPAWQLQEDLHARVATGEIGPQLLLVEHPPTITFGRRDSTPQLLKESPESLAAKGFELVHSDRGGQTTYHGPGQIVAYPIVRLTDLHLSVSGYVHTLERVILHTLAHYGIQAHTDPSAIGVWVGPPPAKIAAVGVRIRQGTTLHGLALNVCPDLGHFDTIIPCGIADRSVTSIHRLLPNSSPTLSEVAHTLIHFFQAVEPPLR